MAASYEHDNEASGSKTSENLLINLLSLYKMFSVVWVFSSLFIFVLFLLIYLPGLYIISTFYSL